MRNVISTITAIVIALVVFSGVAYFGFIKKANFEFVGTAVVAEPGAWTQVKRTLVMVEPGVIIVSSCSKGELSKLLWVNASRCLDTKYVGNGSLIVKTVNPAFASDMKFYMDANPGMYLHGVYVVDGKLSAVLEK